MLSNISIFLWKIGFKKLGCKLFIWVSNRKVIKYNNLKEVLL